MEKTVLTIKLGGEKFQVRKPLGFGQLRVIEPLTQEVFADVKAQAKFSVETYNKLATILMTACGVEKLSAEKLNNLQTTSKELFDAFKIICDASCMFAKGDAAGDQKGEARASTGDTSTQT
jgi:hypothetical protein